MGCPHCKISLSNTIIGNTEVDYCPKCHGLWFEKGELDQAKDAKDNNLKWLDIDLWQDEAKFKISPGKRICPSCRVPLYEVYYGKSGVIVDMCNLCNGIWLDRPEFKKIISWLKKEADYEVLNNYSKVLLSEFSEIFSGPEPFKSEVADFLAVLKVLKYKLGAQLPAISKIVAVLPRQ